MKHPNPKPGWKKAVENPEEHPTFHAEIDAPQQTFAEGIAEQYLRKMAEARKKGGPAAVQKVLDEIPDHVMKALMYM